MSWTRHLKECRVDQLYIAFCFIFVFENTKFFSHSSNAKLSSFVRQFVEILFFRLSRLRAKSFARNVYILVRKREHITLFLLFKIFASKIYFSTMPLLNDNHFRIVAKINRHEVFVDFLCDRCFVFDRFCVAMKNINKSAKCFECVRAKRFCVNMSWQFLNKTREDLFSKIDDNEKFLTTIIVRLLRNKKILKKMNARTKKKTQCFLSKLNETNVSIFNNCFVVDTFVNLFSIIWFFMSMLNNFSNVDDIIVSTFDNASNS